MSQAAIRSLHPSRAAPRESTFEEQLYEGLRAAPWWLASVAAHGAAFLLLSVLAGGSAVAPAFALPTEAAFAPPVPVLDDPIEPDVLATDPIDEPEDVREIPTIEDLKDPDPSDIEENVDPSNSPVFGDSRSPGDGLWDGPGDNATMGVGGNRGGGGLPGGLLNRRTLRMKADGDVLDAADAGLEWLRRHQSPAGHWDCDAFETMCTGNRCGGAGGPLFDPGVTGLALLPFLGCGETHKSPRYGSVVRNGLKYLKGIQDAEGCFGARTSNHFIYNHAIASLAMIENYAVTKSPLFKTSAANAVQFILQCRNPYQAWRYGVRPQDNDTSVTGWMVMALKSAVLADLEVDPEAFEGARAWMDKVTEPEYGRAGYTARGNGPARPQELMDRFPMDKSESLTAVAVLTRIFCGEKPDDPMVRKGADLCMRSLPTWDEAAGTIDYYYWYYGTLAMFQVGGEPWKRWNEAMKASILDHQRLDKGDHRYGSWDPIDPWSADGGRVYSTAVNTLNLEVYYRYARVAGTK